MAKALGADIKEFYDHNWPEGYFHDDNSLEFHGEGSGEWLLEDNKKYELNECGCIVAEEGGECESFAYFFNKWMKKRNTVVIVVTVPKEREAEVRAALTALGLKA